jgi:hypothetical protein
VAALTNFQNGQVDAFTDGGVGTTLTLPLTTIDESGFGSSPYFAVIGTGSKLNFSAVTTWKGAGSASNPAHINVWAFSGGVVDLSHVGNITAGNSYFQALDGGQIKLDALTSFTGAVWGGSNALDARRSSAVITAPGLASLSNVDLYQGGNATLPVASLTSFQHGQVDAFTDGVGTVLALPVTTIDESGFGGSPYFAVIGTGSKLNLSAVTTWKGAGSAGNPARINVWAFSGGVLDLSHVATISAGNSYCRQLI